MHGISRVRGSHRGGGGLAWALLLFVVLQAGPAFAQGEEDEAYKSAVGAAVQEFAGGNWAEARALFKRAHDLSPNARTLRGMGMAAYELRLYVPALRELEGALRDTRKPLDAEQVEQAKKLIKLASAFVGRYRVVLEPANAVVSIDGSAAHFEPGQVLLLELGAHELSAIAPGFERGAVKFNTEGGEDKELPLQLLAEAEAGVVPAAPPVPQEMETTTDDAAEGPSDSGPNVAPWAWVMVGTTAVFGGIAGGMWAMGSSGYSDLEKECGSTQSCTDKEIDDSGVSTADTLTSVFLGLSGAAAVTAIVLFIVDAGQEDEAPAVSFNVGPGSLLVDGRF